MGSLKSLRTIGRFREVPALTLSGHAETADLVKVHPGFRDATSAVLHRFGVDAAYNGWHSALLSRCRTGARVRPPSGGPSRDKVLRALFHNQEPDDRLLLSERGGPWKGRKWSSSREVENGLGVNRVAFRLTTRNSPSLFGAGLIDGVSESELEQEARDQPTETRGQVHRLKDGRLGRFGWKVQVARLEDFVLTACANELGLEVPRHHQAASPLAPDAKARGLDLTAEECAALVDYVRSLAPPVSPAPRDAQEAAAVAAGRELFHSAGCASCHTANLGSIRGIYSDLLLHDMGAELSDSGSYYATEVDEFGAMTLGGMWRTPPLWGFRDTAPYLHDGRARNLEEAVALHLGQGKASALKFRAMSEQERSRVETFLNSLAARPRAGRPIAPGKQLATRRTIPRGSRLARGRWGGQPGLHARGELGSLYDVTSIPEPSSPVSNVPTIRCPFLPWNRKLSWSPFGSSPSITVGSTML